MGVEIVAELDEAVAETLEAAEEETKKKPPKVARVMLDIERVYESP